MFGVKYRTSQFCATIGMDIISFDGEIMPKMLLSKTEVSYKGGWFGLEDEDSINSMVVDEIGIIPPLLVLKALINLVHEYNFGFLRVWQGNKVPERFLSTARSVSSKSSSPLISQLVQEKMATIKELEEYYSLQDAFKMFDILVTKGINEALANEAATKK